MGGVNRDALNAAFARHVARVLGPQAAYAPAERCPQGHLNLDEDDKPCAVGALCHSCALDYWWPSVGVTLEHRFREVSDHAHDSHWHPEWRIGPGKPRDFCGSVDLLIPLFAQFDLGWDVWPSRVHVWRWTVLEIGTGDGIQATEQVRGDRHDVTVWATALVQSALRVLGEVTPDARETGPAATCARD
jgi:hypothetical protein